MRLLLIRHGQTPANVAGELSTDAPGPLLTVLGQRQAAEIPRALANDPVDAIFVSTLVRTHATAAPLAADRGLTPVQLPGTQEIEAGDLEGRTDVAAVHTYLQTAYSWGMGDRDVVMPGATDGHEFFARFDASIREVVESGSGTAVVVSHGAAIRVWVAGSATNVPPTFVGENELDNTGIVELEGSPDDGWTLLSWQGTPVGGADLVDENAGDPTGEPLNS